MSDLSTMYQNGMGSVASFYGGQNQSLNREQELQKLAMMKQKAQQDAVMNPLEAQFRQGQVAQQAAQLPGIQGQSASLAAQGTEDTMMLATKLASKLSAASAQMGQDGMTKMAQDAERFGQAAQIVKGLPVGAHKQAIAAITQKYGGDPNSPMVKGLLELPDDKVAPALEVLAKGFALSSKKFIQEKELKDSENASQERVNKANNDRALEVARIGAESRKAAAAARQAAVKHMNIDQSIAMYEAIPESERTDEDRQTLQNLKAYALTKAAAGANGVPAAVMGMPTPTQNAQTAAQQLTPTTAPQTPPATSSLGDAVKASGWAYEPTKYEYRVNPTTGKVERRAK